VGLDYLLLKPVLGGYEVENMGVRAATAPVVLHERFGAEPRWSGGAFLRFQARQAGDHLTLELPLRCRGRYALKLHLARQPVGGQGQVFFDGRRVGETLDSYHAVASPSTFGVGEIRAKAGRHTLTVEVVGRNERSAGYEIGLDQIEWEPLKAPSYLIGWIVMGLIAIVLGGAVWRWWNQRRTKDLPGRQR
jgi:hypothetical protein